MRPQPLRDSNPRNFKDYITPQELSQRLKDNCGYSITVERIESLIMADESNVKQMHNFRIKNNVITVSADYAIQIFEYIGGQ